jgi:CBS domain-containing protein
MKVRDVMHRDVITVAPQTPLKEVARTLVEHGISGVPVVDEHGTVLGVVSETDLLVKERGEPARRPRLLARLFGPEPADAAAKAEAVTAAEAMTAPAITITADRPLREAAALMVERQINRLPVVEDGRLVGIVTRADLVRAFVRSDEELRRFIVEEVIQRAMWLDPRTIQVTVEEGIVRLTGTVDRRSSVPILENLVRAVEGVVAVEAHLGWIEDDTGIEPPPPDYVSPR